MKIRKNLLLSMLLAINLSIPQTMSGQGYIMPVGLTNFSAINVGHEVQLEWETVNEIHNEYFTIERSVDSVDFELVTVVRDTSASYAPMSYFEIDDNPLPGQSYYRLKQSDLDGNVKYSQIEAIQVLPSADYEDFLIYPNPVASDHFNANLPAIDGHATVVITDVSGREVFRNKIYLSDSRNIIIQTPNRLVPGQYSVTLLSDSGYWVDKLIMQ